MEPEGERMKLGARVRRVLVGGARSPHDPGTFHSMSLIAFFAWVGLGADGLSSAVYGPSEAFAALGDYHYLGLFVALATGITVLVISYSYSQIIELFPTGGGGYLVASRLLSEPLGMIAGCALLIDYVLTIALSVAAGGDAIFSFLPAGWLPYRLWFEVAGICLLLTLNMRGVRESVVPLLPVFMVFILTHAFAIVYNLGTHVLDTAAVVGHTASELREATGQFGTIGVILLIMRAYSMGAGTFTGIEAVSNALPILREPKVRTGKRTMLYMAVSLVFAAVGLMLCYIVLRLPFEEGKTLNAVMLEVMTAGWPSGLGHGFVVVTLFSEAAILFVAAQTGFLGGPRVLANMALDRWFPTRFATLSDRLVTQNGVLLMGGAALILLVVSGGSVAYLLVLYSITVFITFVLAQSGMVRYWWSNRAPGRPWRKGIAVNGTGLVLSTGILVTMVILKFGQGGWLTLIVMGVLIAVAVTIRRHYEHTRKLLGRLDSLVAASGMTVGKAASTVEAPAPELEPARGADVKTAVILVNGFNGLGLHTLFNVIRLFRASFQNYVFIQIGVVDAGNFKGVEELGHLQAHIDSELNKYVRFMNHEGYYAAQFSAIGIDAVEEITKLVPRVVQQFPQSVFFGGQIVFPEETWLSRLLHNYIVFTVQRQLYTKGIPFVILPIRV